MTLLRRLIVSLFALSLLIAPALAASSLPPPVAGVIPGTFVDGGDARLQDGYVLGCTRGASPKSLYSGTAPGAVLSHYQMTCPGGAVAGKLVFGGYFQDPANQRDTATGVSAYRCNGASVVAGGSGFVVGDRVVLANTNAIGQTCVLRVLAVNSGAITQVAMQVPGVYSTPLAPGAAQASTYTGTSGAAGGGSGATFNVTWDLGAYMLHVGIEPVWNTQVLTGASAIVQVTSGVFMAATTGAIVANPDLFVPVGGILTTDAFALSVPMGGAIGLREFSSGVGVPLGHHVGGGSSPIDALYAAGPDWSYTSNTINPTTSSTSGNPVMAPLAMMVKPLAPVKSCVAIGDSIAADSAGPGAVDIGDTSGNMGWVERTFANKIAWTNYSVPSMQMQFLMNTPSGRQELMTFLRIVHPDCVVQQLSINDFRAGITYANFQTEEAQFTSFLSGLGIRKIYGFTTTPDDTGSNMTVNTNSNPMIQARNSAIRGGTGCTTQGYTACFDFGAVVETTPGSGLWPTINGVFQSGEGLHPISAMHVAMAAAAQPWLYAQMNVH